MQINKRENMNVLCFKACGLAPKMGCTRSRVVKGIFVTRDRPFFFPVKCEMAIFFFVNRDFHSSREV